MSAGGGEGINISQRALGYQVHVEQQLGSFANGSDHLGPEGEGVRRVDSDAVKHVYVQPEPAAGSLGHGLTLRDGRLDIPPV